MNNGNSYTYTVYGINIRSEIQLKELDSLSDECEADLTIRLARLDLLGSRDTPLFEFSEDRQVIILPAVGAFVLEEESVFVEPTPGVSEDLLAIPILGPVLAIILHLRGKFVLHGSAIVHEGKAYGFVGDKGAGKSTLAAMLLKNSNVHFLTDDLLVISEDQSVWRGYRQLKLSDEAISNTDQKLGCVRPPPIDQFPKNQFLLNPICLPECYPIGGIFQLGRSSDVRVEDLSIEESMRILLRFSYISRFRDKNLTQEDRKTLFDYSTKIAASRKVKRIFVPESIKELDRVINLL